jgi:hypothetical protein
MNHFGKIFSVSIFGESHGEGLGVVIDGCPAGMPLAVEDFIVDTERRKGGTQKGTTPRQEEDLPIFKSGVFNGKTTGAPLMLLFENKNTRSGDYEKQRSVPRPGHADFVANRKFGGFEDFRGGGHFSGRLTLCLVAAGVVANVENLGLEELGVILAQGVIQTDGIGRTNISGLYAVGDVAGGPMLAHKAAHEGVNCVDMIAGITREPLDKLRIPGCVYAYPQVASVGLSEEKAKKLGINIRIGRFPYRANGKALALGEAEGLVKTIFNAQSGALIGAHLIGAEATELIHGFLIAMNLETTEQELMETVFPHPTLSEAMLESVYDAFGRALHI